MQCNLFIIISVNVIGVSTDKHICDDYYHYSVWVQTFGRDCTQQFTAEVLHEEASRSCSDFEKIKFKSLKEKKCFHILAKSVDHHTKWHGKRQDKMGDFRMNIS